MEDGGSGQTGHPAPSPVGRVHDGGTERVISLHQPLGGFPAKALMAKKNLVSLSFVQSPLTGTF